MPDGWKLWLDWHRTGFPDNGPEIKTLEADRGNYLGYVRVVGRRREDASLEDYCWPDTTKSFRRTGIDTASRTARKWSRDPSKNVGSVSTEIAAAPAVA